MNNSLVEIVGVSKAYPKSCRKSVDGVSFAIQEGEKFGIFGPNGAGKTTLISMLCGITPITEGEILFYFDKKQQITNNLALQFIGFVPQEYAFFMELSPMENLHYFGALYGIKKDEIEKYGLFLLETLGLLHVAHEKTGHFSGGMKRRVNLAIGLIHKPKLLVLDEPTVGVDVQSKVAIMNYLDTLNQQGLTLFYTSHHLNEAEHFCDRIALMDEGKIIALGNISELKEEENVPNLETYFILKTGKEYRD